MANLKMKKWFKEFKDNWNHWEQKWARDIILSYLIIASMLIGIAVLVKKLIECSCN